MARKFFRRYLPHPHKVREHRILSLLGTALHAPNLWHLNRDSVSRAFAVGLFWALIPMPLQMVPAAICAVPFRANVGLSIALVWVTNPLTMGPIYYASHWIGRRILGLERIQLEFEFTYRSLLEHIGEIWQPLYVGSVACGIIIGCAGYLAVQWLWRWNLRRRWRQRPRLRTRATARAANPA